MRIVLIAAVAAVTLVSQVSGQAPAPRVELTVAPGGIVTLITREAPLREILTEWTRKTGTPFVGAERLTGSSLTLEFKGRPETEVLASLLRGAAGYVLGPRTAGTPAGPSQIAVVYVVATSTPTTSGFSAPPPMPASQPQFSTPGSPDNEIPPVAPGRGGLTPANQGQAVPQGSPTPGPTARPVGVNPVAVPIVTVPVTSPTPTPTGTGRGGGGGGGGIR